MCGRRTMTACALLLLVVLAGVGAAFGDIAPDMARSAAAELAAEVVAYGQRCPEVVERLPIRPGTTVRDAILVHSYPELAGRYYVVSLVDESDRVSSVVGIDAGTGQWQWYAATNGSRRLLEVSETRAQDIARELLDVRELQSGQLAFRIVMMPDKRMYWHAGLAGARASEVFIDVQ
ncbi:hypothetical protein AMJ82_06830, partial [candidate division TA06 bacterium SM23_40]